MIDRELIDYSAIDGDSFVGAVRGAAGTAAAAHAGGTPVGQYQCGLISQGGVPSLAAPDGLRTLQQGVQLQEGWAVGANGTILQWDSTTWTAAASPVGVQLNSVSMLSYADGWAVGNAQGGPGGGESFCAGQAARTGHTRRTRSRDPQCQFEQRVLRFRQGLLDRWEPSGRRVAVALGRRGMDAAACERYSPRPRSLQHLCRRCTTDTNYRLAGAVPVTGSCLFPADLGV